MPTRKWGTEKLVNTTATKNQQQSQVTVLSGGRFVVVWQDNSGVHSAVRGQVFDAQGNKVGGEIPLGVAAGNDEADPSVTAMADGSFYATWTQRNGPDNYILGGIYDANGTFVRSQTTVFAFGADDNSVSTRLGSGSAVAWEDPDSTAGDIDFRIFDGSGKGTPVLVANAITAGKQFQPSIAASTDQSTLAVVWDDGFGRIYGRLFDAAGNQFAPQFQVDVTSVGFSRVDPHVVWLSSSEFAVTWTGQDTTFDQNVEMRIFTVAAQQVVPLTNVIQVNGTYFFTQSESAITALPDGGIAVVWKDDSGIGLDMQPAIKLQIFDGMGNRIGRETIVTGNTGGPEDPSVAALPDGRVVVSWTDFSQTGGDQSNSAIRMQIVDPRDGIVVGTDGSDTLYGNDQVNDEITGRAGDDKLVGMGGDDLLYGDGGNDTLNGGKGADTMYGGTGNDTFYVDNADDVAMENSGEGSDTVYAVVNYTLNAGSSIEFLRANAGTTGLTLTGNSLANTVVGGAGNDHLLGGGGADILNGLAGADILTGGSGADSFKIAALTDSTVASSGRDTIMDFSHLAGDKIDLHLIDANAALAGDQAFSFIGANAFSGKAGELRYAASGGDTLVSGDVNGDKAADFSLLIKGALAFSGTDFVL